MTEKYTVELNGMNCPICNKWGRVADSPEEMLDHHPKCTSYTPTSTGEAEEGGELKSQSEIRGGSLDLLITCPECRTAERRKVDYRIVEISAVHCEKCAVVFNVDVPSGFNTCRPAEPVSEDGESVDLETALTQTIIHLTAEKERLEKKLTLWLFEINGFRDFSRSKEEFSDKMEEWLGERLKEFDANLEVAKEQQQL